MARLIGAACVGILIFVALLFAFRVEWYDNVISIEMPEWNNIVIVKRSRATVPTVPAEVPAASAIAGMSTTTVPKTEERVLPAPKPVKYVARRPQDWNEIRLDTTGSTIGWNKLGTTCRIPTNGVIVRLEQWPSPEGNADTFWHIKYVSQKTATLDNPPRIDYCPIGSDQGISDTNLAIFYNLAP